MGYVDTSYSSQGKTVDRVFVSVGNESLRAANQQQWYVSASRGREMAKLYVEDKQAVRSAIARTGERLSAVELMKPKRRMASVMEVLRNHHRFTGFVKARARVIASYWRDRDQDKGGISRA